MFEADELVPLKELAQSSSFDKETNEYFQFNFENEKDIIALVFLATF